MPVSTDFPELFPLCQVVTVNGEWVSYCHNEEMRAGMCKYHRDMCKGGHGRWQGLEVDVTEARSPLTCTEDARE